MIDYQYFASSQALFDPDSFFEESRLYRFSSIRGRIRCLWTFCKKLAFLPFAMLFKALRTVGRLFQVTLVFALLCISFGISSKIRMLFIEKLIAFAQDIGDWVLYPFAFFVFVARHLLAVVVHPRIHLGL
jgi:hypothetical protein